MEQDYGFNGIREYMVTKEGLLIGPQGLPEDQSAVPP